MGSSGVRHIRKIDTMTGEIRSHPRLDSKLIVNGSTGPAYLPGYVTAVVGLCLLWPLLDRVSPLRYLAYAVPMIIGAAVLLANSKSKKINWSFVFVYTILVLYVFVVSMFSSNFTQGFLIVSGLAIGCFSFRMRSGQVDVIFLFVALSQFIYSALSGFSWSEIDLISSSRSGETHTLPFIISLFVGYYALQGRWAHAAIALILVLVAGKRIALLASVVGLIGTALTVQFINKDRLTRLVTAVLFWAVLAVVALNLNQILSSLDILSGYNLDLLTAGRFFGQQGAYAIIAGWDWRHMTFGYGLGMADRTAELTWGIPGVQIHNDYLRLFIDLGICGTALVVFCYLHMVAKSSTGLYFFAVTSIIWISDNTSTYVFYVSMMLVLLGTDASRVIRDE